MLESVTLCCTGEGRLRAVNVEVVQHTILTELANRSLPLHGEEKLIKVRTFGLVTPGIERKCRFGWWRRPSLRQKWARATKFGRYSSILEPFGKLDLAIFDKVWKNHAWSEIFRPTGILGYASMARKFSRWPESTKTNFLNKEKSDKFEKNYILIFISIFFLKLT